MIRIRVAVAVAVLIFLVIAATWQLHRFGALTYFEEERTGSIGLDRLALRASPDTPIRIVLAGTSLTNRGTWTARLGDRLQQCRPGPVKLERISAPGANSVWGQARIRERLAEPADRIDLLVIEFSINDASLFRGIPVNESAAVLDATLRTADAAGVPVLLATMNPAWDVNGLERPGQIAYRALYRARADAGKAALVDTIAAWQALPRDERGMLVPDGLHPTEEAMQRIQVPALFDALQPLVCGE